MKIIKIVLFAFLNIIFVPNYAHAALELVLTQGVDSALPIAIVPFAGQSEQSQDPNNITAVITADLQNSGRFKPLALTAMPAKPSSAAAIDYISWRNTGVESVVVGKVQAIGGDNYKLSFSLLDVFKSGDAGNNHVLLTREITVPGNQLRRAAHHIADLVYEQMTGVKGIFSTRIAYVLNQPQSGENSRYKLIVADVDGYAPKPILTSSEPIMSPSWSHDGSKLAYVSFEDRRAQIFISNIATGTRKKVSQYAGINGAPAWSADDASLALVLSKNGSPKIYTLNLASTALNQITQGDSIDTEPTWSPQGNTIIFTSDRGGSPQLYQVNATGGNPKRVTFKGKYNARGRFTPDGKRLVMIHGEHGYNIAVLDIKTDNLTILTKSGRNDSPSIAPNGMMILYGSEYGELGVVSVDAKVQLRIPANEGKVQDPAWSPFIK